MRGGTARTHRRGDHRDTLSSRNNLAGAYQSAGDLGRAIPLYEQTLADRQRVLAEQAEFWLYEDEYDTSLRIRLWDIPSTGYEAISTVPCRPPMIRPASPTRSCCPPPTSTPRT